MANGGQLHTDDEWKRMEAELKLLDTDLERFALKYNAKVVRKAKEWPGRSLEWKGNVESLMQVFVVNSTTLALYISICVFQDREGKRFWRNETLAAEVQAREIADELLYILEAGKRKIDNWALHPEDLEFGTNLQI